MKKILVTGSSGFLGTRLLTRLAEEAFEVVRFDRARIFDDSYLTQVTQRVDAIVHLMARVHRKGDAAGSLEDYRRDNVDSVRRVCEAGLKHGVRRFIFLSSAAVYGPGDFAQSTFTETSDLRAADPYGVTKQEAEAWIQARFMTEAKSSFTILRPPLIYGSGAPGNFSSLVRILKLPLAIPFGSIRARRSFVSVNTVVEVIRVALSDDQFSNQIFNIADPVPTSVSDFMRYTRAAVRGRAWLFSFPERILSFLLRTLGREKMVLQLLMPSVLDTTKLAKAWPDLSLRTTSKELERIFQSRH